MVYIQDYKISTIWKVLNGEWGSHVECQQPNTISRHFVCSLEPFWCLRPTVMYTVLCFFPLASCRLQFALVHQWSFNFLKVVCDHPGRGESVAFVSLCLNLDSAFSTYNSVTFTASPPPCVQWVCHHHTQGSGHSLSFTTLPRYLLLFFLWNYK